MKLINICIVNSMIWWISANNEDYLHCIIKVCNLANVKTDTGIAEKAFRMDRVTPSHVPHQRPRKLSCLAVNNGLKNSLNRLSMGRCCFEQQWSLQRPVTALKTWRRCLVVYLHDKLNHCCTEIWPRQGFENRYYPIGWVQSSGAYLDAKVVHFSMQMHSTRPLMEAIGA